MPSQYELIELPGRFAVCRLSGDAPIPSWATAGAFFSITRTADELSILIDEASVTEGIRCERGWRGLRVAGAVPFTTVGLLAGLLSPLAEAAISVFAISPFDTDYVLTKEEHWALALDVLRRQDYTIH
jgi:hypothetical protein